MLKHYCDGQGEGDGALLAPETKLPEPLGNEALLLPQRRVDVDLAAVSSVLSQRMLCHPNAPLEFQQNTIPHRGAAKDTREVRPPCPDSPPAPAAIMGGLATFNAVCKKAWARLAAPILARFEEHIEGTLHVLRSCLLCGDRRL